MASININHYLHDVRNGLHVTLKEKRNCNVGPLKKTRGSYYPR